MKSVLISIQPYWVFLIIAKKMGWDVDREKTVEIRKNFPKDENWDKTVKIYCSKDQKSFKQIPEKYQTLMKPYLGKVIGEFVCDKIIHIGKRGIPNNFDYCYLSLNKWGNDDIEVEITTIKNSCVSKEHLNSYGESSSCLYGWHISNLTIYDRTKELGEYFKVCPFDCSCDTCGLFATETPFEAAHCKNPERYITRPPQSWCYAESMLKS